MLDFFKKIIVMMKRMMTTDRGRTRKKNIPIGEVKSLAIFWPASAPHLSLHLKLPPCLISHRTLKINLKIFPMAALNLKIQEWSFCSSHDRQNLKS